MSDISSASGAPVAVQGHVAPAFEAVRPVFEALFASGHEQRGAGLAVTRHGELVVDLWAGVTDRAGAEPFTARTLTPVFSVSKAVCAVIIAKLVEEGALDYAAPASALWPEFAAAGKGAITLEQLLSHQAGLSGFPAESDFSAEDWFDWEKTTAALAAMSPLWTPGDACGYHPITWGYLAGEVVRRATGQTLGAHLGRLLRESFGLDAWIGLPASEHARAATPKKPPAAPDLGELNTPTRLAFLERWSAPRAPQDHVTRWRSAEIPAANGHATASALARILEPFARDGRLGEARFLSSETVHAATRERIAGPNLVLPYDLSFGAGMIRNTGSPKRAFYGPGARTVGHTGFGGSTVLADPDEGLSLAYVTLTQSPALVADTRAAALIAAVYESLKDA